MPLGRNLASQSATRSNGFTPGPWEVYACPIESAQQAKDELAYQVDHTDEIGPSLYLINAGGKCPATTGCGPTSEANAHLIAASPTMADYIQRKADEGCEEAARIMETIHARS